MKRLNRNSNDPPKHSDSDPCDEMVSRGPDTKCGSNPMKLMGIFVVCLMGLSVLFSISVILRDSSSSSDSIWGGAEARVLEMKPPQGTSFSTCSFFQFTDICLFVCLCFSSSLLGNIVNWICTAMCLYGL